MEQKTILSATQRRFLDLVLKEPYLLKHYYWTGGTVLSEFYLHHRESYDIDLFTDKSEVHLPSISKFVGIAGTLLKAKKISHTRYLGLQSFMFSLHNEELKVDFNYYPFPQIERGKNWKGLKVDSLLDIAVNKIHTISMKPRARDYIDIYCILKNAKDDEYSLNNLIKLAKIKFDWHIEPTQLGENFLKVVTFTESTKMLVPFDRNDMEKFFVKLAKSLEGEIFK